MELLKKKKRKKVFSYFIIEYIIIKNILLHDSSGSCLLGHCITKVALYMAWDFDKMFLKYYCIWQNCELKAHNSKTGVYREHVKATPEQRWGYSGTNGGSVFNNSSYVGSILAKYNHTLALYFHGYPPKSWASELTATCALHIPGSHGTVSAVSRKLLLVVKQTFAWKQSVFSL